VPKGAVTPGGASQHAARHARVAPSESLAARAQGHSAAALRLGASRPQAAPCAARPRPPRRTLRGSDPAFPRVVQVR